MRVPTADYTTQQNAIANKYQAKSGKYLAQQININTSNAKVAQKSLQLSDKSLELSKKSLDNQQTLALAQQEYYQSMARLNKWAFAVDTTQKIVSSVYSIVQARDESKVKSAIMDILSENDERATTSVVNQKNKFITDPETGEMKAVIDSELTEWQNSQYEKIKSMGLTTEVEKSAMATLQEAFGNTKSTILEGMAKDAAQGLQEYNLLLEERALGQDLYSISFDDFINPDIDDSQKYTSGFALIDGRNYYSDSEKKTAKENYRLKSDEQRAQYYVAEAAKTGGKVAAYTRAEQLRDYLNLDDATVTNLLKYANTVEGQYVDALSTQMSEAMTTGLKNGVLPDEIYRNIVSQLEGESEEHKNEAMQAAMNAHVTWATADVSAIISGYSSVDEASLTQMLSDLSERSSYYKGGAEAVFDKAVSQVSKQLKDLVGEPAAEALISNIDAVKANNKAVKAANQGFVNAVKTGDISAYDAAFMIERTDLKFSEDYLDALLDPDSEEYNPELYAEIISSHNDSMKLLNEALESYKDHSLYSLFNDLVKNAESNLLNIWKTSVKDLQASKDENKKSAYLHFKAYVSGSLIDLMNETTSKELSAEDIYNRYENIKNIAIGSCWKDMTSETLMDSAKSTPTESALKTIQIFKDNPDAVYYNDYSGNLVWFDQKMQSTFDNAAIQIRNDLEEQFGLQLDEKPDITIKETASGAYPVARFKSTNGKEYRVDGDGNVFVVGASGNLISYGKLGETPDPVQTKTAETFAGITVAEAVGLASQAPSIPKPNIPSVSYINDLIEEGYTPEEAVQKAVSENPPEAFTITKPAVSTNENKDAHQSLKEWNDQIEENTRRQKDQEFANRNSGTLTSNQEAYASEIEAEGYDYNEARQLAPLVDKYRVEEKLSFDEALKKAVRELGIKER